MKKNLAIIGILLGLFVLGAGVTLFVSSHTNDNPPQRDSVEKIHEETVQARKDSANDKLRREAVVSVLARSAEWAANNNGKTPPDVATVKTIMEQSGKGWPLPDPGTGKSFVLVDATPQLGEIQYKAQTICDGQNIKPASDPILFVVRTRLSDNTILCEGY